MDKEISNDMAAAKAALAANDCTLAIAAHGTLNVLCRRGVKDLLELLSDNPQLLHGAAVADKVVGKGAAALMILGKVAAVYTPVISAPALQFFENAGVDIEYGTVVPNIINRKGDGICPVESLCINCTSPADCLPLIKDFVAKW